MKANQLLNSTELRHYMRGGTLENKKFNLHQSFKERDIFKGNKEQLLAWRIRFSPKRNDCPPFPFKLGYNATKTCDPSLSAILDPCPYCAAPRPLIANPNAFKDGQFRADGAPYREYTYVKCWSCGYRVAGGPWHSDTMATKRWDRACKIMLETKKEICPNSLIYLIDGTEIDVSQEKMVVHSGNGHYENYQMVLFGERSFHAFFRNGSTDITEYRYHRLSFKTLLEHHVNRNHNTIWRLIKKQEEEEGIVDQWAVDLKKFKGPEEANEDFEQNEEDDNAEA